MYLGIDTSNYTTSLALYDGETVQQYKQLLHVKEGERGLRQSDALFQHVVNLPALMRQMRSALGERQLRGVGVSTRPRDVEGSYMPCFLAGEAAAETAAASAGISLYPASHQTGHVLAALYSVGRLDLINDTFLAFHVSGGTTEALLVTPDPEGLFTVQMIAQSSDLKAGQAVDRVGVMLGLPFPAGNALDSLACRSDKTYQIKPSLKGLNCSLSGIENQCRRMMEQNEAKEDIAKFCIQSVLAALERMTQLLLTQHGKLPLLFAGGVMSNTLIRETLIEKYNAMFAQPAFSCDNAAGTAIQAYLKDKQARI